MTSNIRLAVTTVVRAAEQGEVHGGLYILNYPDLKILNKTNFDDHFENNNKRGGERGLRGVVFLDGILIVANSNGLMKVDPSSLAILDQVNNPSIFNAIHEICYHDNHIWVTSTGNNCIVKVDLNFEVKEIWHIQGQPFEFHQLLISKERVEDVSDLKDENHLNSISAYNGRVVFGGALTPLYDLETMKKSCDLYAGGFTHNFQEYHDMFISNKTTLANLEIISEEKSVLFKIPKFTEKNPFPDKIAKPNWNRGLLRHENLLFIGSSPARILVFDLNSFSFIDEFRIDTDIRHCVHGIEAIGV